MAWHRCSRWWRAGVVCPFGGKRHPEEPEDDEDDDGDGIPVVPIPARVPRKRPPKQMSVKKVAELNLAYWEKELEYVRGPEGIPREGREPWRNPVPELIPALLALMLAAGLGKLFGNRTSDIGRAGAVAEKQLSEAFRSASDRSRKGGSTRRGLGSRRGGRGGFADNYWERLGILPRIGNRKVRDTISDGGFVDPFGGLV